jgi:hypothetical protein
MPVIAPKAIGNESRPERPAGPSCGSAVTVTAMVGSLLSGELAAGCRDDVCPCVGVPLEAPSPLR